MAKIIVSFDPLLVYLHIIGGFVFVLVFIGSDSEEYPLKVMVQVHVLKVGTMNRRFLYPPTHHLDIDFI